MANAREIIERACRLLGVLDPNETADASMLSNGLTALNAMFGWLSGQRMTMHAVESVSHALTSGTASYTIGSGADIDTSLPQKIITAEVRDSSGRDYPVDVETSVKFYRSMSDKTSTSYPKYLYFERSYPTGTIYLWPAPTSGLTLRLALWKAISSVTAQSTISFPPEYEDMLTYNLALRLAPEYPESLKTIGTITPIATNSLKVVKKMNAAPVTRLRTDPFTGNDNYNIQSDDWVG